MDPMAWVLGTVKKWPHTIGTASEQFLARALLEQGYLKEE